jgi:formate/nitrite transporter
MSDTITVARGDGERERDCRVSQRAFFALWRGLLLKPSTYIITMADRSKTINFLPPPDIYKAIAGLGEAKGKMPWWKTLYLGILAGCYIAYGCTLAISLGGQLPNADPGHKKLLFGAFGLPFGLTMVLVCGAELVTGNFAIMTVAFLEGKATLAQVLQNWSVSYVGNFIGSLFIVALNYGNMIFDEDVQAVAFNTSRNISLGKTSATWARMVCGGILCNWLVCLAIWQATAAQDIVGKVFGIFWPICAFVAIGYEHVVANMFLIPMGMAMGSGVSVGDLLWENIVPVTIGNAMAAIFLVAGSYSLMYGAAGAKLESLLSPPVDSDDSVEYSKDLSDVRSLKDVTVQA